MLTQNIIKQKIAERQPVYGLFSSIASPTAIELIAEAGFDFVIIDTEHVLVNPETLENMVRAADALGLTPFVRITDNNPKTILKVLDCGAKGIVIPMVEDADQLADIVAAAKYFPLGNRSLNGGRAGAFGKQSLGDYCQYANQQIMIIAMIESQLGITNIKQILANPHLDLILEGAADLSQSLGLPWQINAPEVQDALRILHSACTAADVPYCTIPRADGDHVLWQQRGVTTFVLGEERGIAFRALQQKLNSVTAHSPNKVTTGAGSQATADKQAHDATYNRPPVTTHDRTNEGTFCE